MGKKYRVGCKGLDEFGRGQVVFNNKPFAVSYFLPGEKGEIELVYKTRETTARLVSVDTESKDRVAVDCPGYESCGGCQLLHMAYTAQMDWKQKQIEELFHTEHEQGKIERIIPMKRPWHYRHKVYATFSSGKKGEIVAGIYEENSHKVVEMKDCCIQNKLANEIIEEVVNLMRQTGTKPYNEDRWTGVLRHVYIRIGEKTGQVMVVLVTGCAEFKEKAQFVEGLLKKFPQITTIIHNVNMRKTSMVLGTTETVLYGNGVIEDKLCGLHFELSSRSFYQVNPVQTEKLYQKAVEFAGLTGKETVLDAYCGIGTISLVAAKRAKSVIGVEVNEIACRDARKNARKNKCKNVTFIDADASEFMMEEAKKGAEGIHPDVVFMDPPRSGSDVKFLNALAAIEPEKIVYISCNPATQKVDTDILKRKGYQIDKIQAVDCFCHTYHVENIVVMTKSKNK